MEVPEIRYARSADLSIAYQSFGEGPADLVVVRGSLSDLASAWEQPLFVRHLEGLAASARVLLFDKRGMGLSDRLRDVPSLSARTDDIRAVMDHAGVEQAALLAAHESARLAILFAATYPERTRGLILFDPSVKGRSSPDYPWGRTDAEWRAWLREVSERWGTPELFSDMLHRYSPTVADDPEFRRWYERHMRSSASPGAAAAYQRMLMDSDVTGSLGAVRVPTVILHRPQSAAEAEWIATRVGGARLVEIPGLVDGYSWADPDRNQVLIDETAAFLRVLEDHHEAESVLGTFLFTDIVGSTERAAALGDSRWAALLGRHHAVVRRRLEEFRGEEAGTAGDGFYAVFQAPGRAVRCARAIRDDVRGLGLEIRAGVHTGEGQLIDGHIGGIAVHIAARVAALAGAGEILVSRTVKDLLVGSGVAFDDRGVHALKGVEGTWELYAVA